MNEKFYRAHSLAGMHRATAFAAHAMAVIQGLSTLARNGARRENTAGIHPLRRQGESYPADRWADRGERGRSMPNWSLEEQG
jgi:hypothetical protein